MFSRIEGRWDWDCMSLPESPATAGEHCTFITDDPFYGFHDNCTDGSWCMGGTLQIPLQSDQRFRLIPITDSV